MPDQSALGAIPIPTGNEAHVVPADLALMADRLDRITVLPATSAANRDALYATPPRVVSPGQLVSRPGALDRRNDAGNGWDTIWSSDGPIAWQPQRISNNAEQVLSSPSLSGFFSRHDRRLIRFSIRFDVTSDTALNLAAGTGPNGWYRWTFPVNASSWHEPRVVGSLVTGGSPRPVFIRHVSQSYFFLMLADGTVLGNQTGFVPSDYLQVSGDFWAA